MSKQLAISAAFATFAMAAFALFAAPPSRAGDDAAGMRASATVIAAADDTPALRLSLSDSRGVGS